MPSRPSCESPASDITRPKNHVHLHQLRELLVNNESSFAGLFPDKGADRNTDQVDYDTQQLGLGLDILQFEDQQPLTLEPCRRIVALGQHILIDTPTAPLAAVMYELVYIEILRPIWHPSRISA